MKGTQVISGFKTKTQTCKHFFFKYREEEIGSSRRQGKGRNDNSFHVCKVPTALTLITQ